MFEETTAWLNVAKDEIETLITYNAELERVQDKAALKEIMGDEVNHALIALLSASTLLGLSVPDDNLEALFAKVFPEVSDEA